MSVGGEGGGRRSLEFSLKKKKKKKDKLSSSQAFVLYHNLLSDRK